MAGFSRPIEKSEGRSSLCSSSGLMVSETIYCARAVGESQSHVRLWQAWLLLHKINLELS